MMIEEGMCGWVTRLEEDFYYSCFVLSRDHQESLECRYITDVIMLSEVVGSGSKLFKIVEDVE
jgi:hypothetical protein